MHKNWPILLVSLAVLVSGLGAAGCKVKDAGVDSSVDAAASRDSGLDGRPASRSDGGVNRPTDARLEAGTTIPVTQSCLDRVQDQDETDVDCGGVCGRCPFGRKCKANTDCVSGACSADGKCVECLDASMCSGTDDECQRRACTAGLCSALNTSKGTPLKSQIPGDCKQKVCDGAGGVMQVVADDDKPNDNNACTEDVCTSGVAKNPPKPVGETCGVDQTCDGKGGCIGCAIAPERCPPLNNTCGTRLCVNNVCQVTYVPDGTLTADQLAGDCRVNQCDGKGNVVMVDRDGDVPEDKNPCTSDRCSKGTPSHANEAANTPCSDNNSRICNGSGTCVECIETTRCAGEDNECQTRTCEMGACGIKYAAQGKPLSSQLPGDCKRSQCNGKGEVVVVNDDADKPVDSSQCTQDVCSSGKPSNPPEPAKTMCSMSGRLCEGTGSCVECLEPSDCPGTDNECQKRTCVANKCGVANTAAGTALAAQTVGDCKRVQCDGSGNIVTVNDDADLNNDSNECTQDLCGAGTASNPPAGAGLACGANQVCDGTGKCVGCNVATDCKGSDDECAKRTCVDHVCGWAYTANGTAVSAQTAGDCKKKTCDGKGKVATVNDDSDVPVDGNECTGDVCSNGVKSNPSSAARQTCNGSMGLCNGKGSCVQCLVDTDCGGTKNDCQHPVCNTTTNKCEVAYTAVNTPLSTQAPGDCKTAVCDGKGGTTSINTDTDLPANTNPCVTAACSAGTPSFPPKAKDTACTGGMGQTKCDGAGKCVQCYAASECGTATPCATPTCSAMGLCVTSYTGAGVALAPAQQSAGDCLVKTCDGKGLVIDAADDQDKPTAQTAGDCVRSDCKLGQVVAVDDTTDPKSDGNDCTKDTCSKDATMKPITVYANLPAGSTCGSGNVCDGAGGCMKACATDADCKGTTACTKAVCNPGTLVCSLTNIAAGPAPDAYQAAGAGDCQKVMCDGAGKVATPAADPADVPADDGNQCTDEVCAAAAGGGLTPTHPNAAAGKACNQNGGTACDGAGACSATFMVVRIGDAGDTVNASTVGAAVPAFIEERFLTNGAVKRTIALPQVASTGNNPFVLATAQDGEGTLTRSADGRFLTLAGYATAPAAADPVALAGVQRVVARIDAAGAVDTTTLLGTAFAGDTVQAAVTDTGDAFWVAGAGAGGIGAYRVLRGGSMLTALATPGPTGIGPTAAHACVIVGTPAQLVCANPFAGTSPVGVFTLGTGLPTAPAAATPLPLAPLTAPGAPYGFAMLDLNAAVAGVDTLYFADAAGITKLTFNGTAWATAASFTVAGGSLGGARGVAASVSASGAVLLLATTTDGTKVVSLLDNGMMTPAPVVVASAPAPASLFRGVALPPQ